jgi:glucose/arabinose dehydrogenase/mono/diheme cytochrome c family protein
VISGIQRFLQISVLFFLVSCNSGTATEQNISTDRDTIAKGTQLFSRHCSSCHNMQRDEIGPALGGITQSLPVDHLIAFIKDPQKVIASGNEHAVAVSKKFNSIMPPFALEENDIRSIIAYIHTQPLPSGSGVLRSDSIKDPVPEKIPLSNVSVNIEPVTTFPATSKAGEHPFTRITKLDFQPGTGQLFVCDLRGKLYRLMNNQPEVFLDIIKERPAFISEPGLATGFGGFAFHPLFSKNHLLYTTHTEKPKTKVADYTFEDSLPVEVQWVLTEWKIDDPNAGYFKGTSRELLRIDMVAGAHGVQEIAFNPLTKPGDKDFGLLYIGVGDGASIQLGYPFVAHGKDRIWGSLLRIDPLGSNSANGKYGIPSSNPFFNPTPEKSVKEVYAYGFRNPHRFTWTKNNELLVINIGQANVESLYKIKAGDNCGWPYREGPFEFDPRGDLNKVYPLPVNDSIEKIKYPVARYDHDEGAAISGGYEYTGKMIGVLKNKYVFGDIPSGRLFYIEISDLQKTSAPIKEWKITINGRPATLKELCGSDRVDLHFGRDMNGELYILTKADGKLYKLKAS